MIKELEAMLEAATKQAQADRAHRRKAGTLAAQSDAGGNSGPAAAEASSSQSGTDTGFYRVVRRGVHLVGITNGMTLSGIVQIPVEAGHDKGELSSVTISANDSAIEGTRMLSAPFSYPLRFSFNTRRLANGSYSLKASGLWLFEETNAFGLGNIQIPSPSFTVNITNAIFYPEWVQDYRSDLMIIKIRTAQLNVNWEVDVFGEALDYIGTFSDFSSDGVIAFAWNLVAPGNILRNDNVFYTQTTITGSGFSPASTGPQPNPPLIKVVDNYPPVGMWVVARAEYMPSSVHNYDLYVEMVNGFAQMGESMGGVLPAPGFYRNYNEALFIPKQSGLTNWAVMTRALTNRAVRNFYFDGHGSPDSIGPSVDANGEGGQTLPASGSSQHPSAMRRRAPTRRDIGGCGSTPAIPPWEPGPEPSAWEPARTCL